MIELQNVSMSYPEPKRYKDYISHPFRKNGSRSALLDINLKISKGESMAFLGPNGAGKTTLLKLVGGLLYPTDGRVILDDYDTNKDNHYVRGKVGYVLNEERSFYWRLTGVQNLEFFGALDNIYGPELQARIHELLNVVGLESSGNVRVSNFSSGMRQRLAIARGLLSDPDILILDEPTKAIDPLGAQQLREIIAHAIQAKQGKTLLIATHLCEEAEEICDRVCIIFSGQIIAIKSVNEIKCDYGKISGYYREVISQLGDMKC